ncbi:hypothetical protein SKAU_G00389390 [Synaphobranchus kaupii]|uniref:Uncharacterized protein n=1 Tax=Synaphobranchus kaupii TaxID=118154 RepID=A0A9Q1IDG7_SYNKA|nr:hypothetical protein SKAU_G00389390 [Synaphobranchus kaupii]
MPWEFRSLIAKSRLSPQTGASTPHLHGDRAALSHPLRDPQRSQFRCLCTQAYADRTDISTEHRQRLAEVTRYLFKASAKLRLLCRNPNCTPNDKLSFSQRCHSITAAAAATPAGAQRRLRASPDANPTCRKTRKAVS